MKEFLSLRELYKVEKIENGADAFILALHHILMKTDFKPYDEDSSNDSSLQNILEKWKNDGYLIICYEHINFPGVYCHVFFITVGSSYFFIYGDLEDELNKDITTHFNMNKYINDNDLSDPFKVYKNFDELQRIFRDEICFSLLAEIQYSVGYNPVFGLPGLDSYLKYYIIEFLPLPSLIALSSVNKEFNYLVNASLVWKRLFNEHFKTESEDLESDECMCEKGLGSYWKEKFKKSYLRKNNFKELISPFSPESLHFSQFMPLPIREDSTSRFLRPRKYPRFDLRQTIKKHDNKMNDFLLKFM